MFDFEAAFDTVQKRREEIAAEELARRTKREERLDELIHALQSFIDGRELEFKIVRKSGKIIIGGDKAGTMEVEVDDRGTFALTSRGAEYSAQSDIEGVEMQDAQTAEIIVNWLTAPFH